MFLYKVRLHELGQLNNDMSFTDMEIKKNKRYDRIIKVITKQVKPVDYQDQILKSLY